VASTRFDVAVFDFDGTLVQSAERKQQAFFDIFPSECSAVVATVLASHPEASRYDIIPRIIAEAQRTRVATLANVDDLIDAYARLAMASVADAPEIPGAGRVICAFAERMATYLLSATPLDQLQVLLAQRGWVPYFSRIYGYPCEKSEVVSSLLCQHAIPPSRFLIVGDGPGDKQAAMANGCEFFRISQPGDLLGVLAFADIADA
jgi:phosphoglycolate phosphatase-like HAD superfamily hydrolase